MTHFMIFGDTAVNMALVRLMKQEGHSVLLIQGEHPDVRVHHITIDDILTAQAAGQSRVSPAATSPAATVAWEDSGLPAMVARITGQQPQPSMTERRSKRFREPERNDPQALRSIGR